MMIRHVLLIAAGSAVLAACSSPQGNLPPIQKMEQTVYRLGAGDEVRISVFGLDALTNTYVVGDAGTISLPLVDEIRSEEHTSELQSLMRISYAVFCLKKKNKKKTETRYIHERLEENKM